MPQKPILTGLKSAGPRKFTATEQELRDLLNKPPKDQMPSSDRLEDPPTVWPAPPFRQPPTVLTSDPSVLKSVKTLLDIAPELRGQLKRITSGPDLAAMEYLGNAGLQPFQYPTSNLLGTTDIDTRSQVSINPALDVNDTASTLAHEAAHVVGGIDSPRGTIPPEIWQGMMKRLPGSLRGLLGTPEQAEGLMRRVVQERKP
jgi:hypothetical protein